MVMQIRIDRNFESKLSTAHLSRLEGEHGLRDKTTG